MAKYNPKDLKKMLSELENAKISDELLASIKTIREELSKISGDVFSVAGDDAKKFLDSLKKLAKGILDYKKTEKGFSEVSKGINETLEAAKELGKDKSFDRVTKEVEKFGKEFEKTEKKTISSFNRMAKSFAFDKIIEDLEEFQDALKDKEGFDIIRNRMGEMNDKIHQAIKPLSDLNDEFYKFGKASESTVSSSKKSIETLKNLVGKFDDLSKTQEDLGENTDKIRSKAKLYSDFLKLQVQEQETIVKTSEDMSTAIGKNSESYSKAKMAAFGFLAEMADKNKYVVAGIGISKVSESLHSVLKGITDTAVGFRKYNVEMATIARATLVAPGGIKDIEKVRDELHLTTAEAQEFYKLASTAVQGGVIGMDELEGAAKNLRETYGGLQTDKLQNLVDLLKEIPTLNTSLDITADADERADAWFALAKKGKVKQTIELRAAGQLGGEKEGLAPGDVAIVNQQQATNKWLENISKYAHEFVPAVTPLISGVSGGISNIAALTSQSLGTLGVIKGTADAILTQMKINAGTSGSGIPGVATQTATGGSPGFFKKMGESVKSGVTTGINNIKSVGVGGGALALGGAAFSGYETYSAAKESGESTGNAVGQGASSIVGTVAGTAIGAALGGPVGAMIGGTIGSAAGEYLGKTLFKKSDEEKKREASIKDSMMADEEKSALEMERMLSGLASAGENNIAMFSKMNMELSHLKFDSLESGISYSGDFGDVLKSGTAANQKTLKYLKKNLDIFNKQIKTSNLTVGHRARLMNQAEKLAIEGMKQFADNAVKFAGDIDKTPQIMLNTLKIKMNDMLLDLKKEFGGTSILDMFGKNIRLAQANFARVIDNFDLVSNASKGAAKETDDLEKTQREQAKSESPETVEKYKKETKGMDEGKRKDYISKELEKVEKETENLLKENEESKKKYTPNVQKAYKAAYGAESQNGQKGMNNEEYADYLKNKGGMEDFGKAMDDIIKSLPEGSKERKDKEAAKKSIMEQRVYTSGGLGGRENVGEIRNKIIKEMQSAWGGRGASPETTGGIKQNELLKRKKALEAIRDEDNKSALLQKERNATLETMVKYAKSYLGMMQQYADLIEHDPSVTLAKLKADMAEKEFSYYSKIGKADEKIGSMYEEKFNVLNRQLDVGEKAIKDLNDLDIKDVSSKIDKQFGKVTGDIKKVANDFGVKISKELIDGFDNAKNALREATAKRDSAKSPEEKAIAEKDISEKSDEYNKALVNITNAISTGVDSLADPQKKELAKKLFEELQNDISMLKTFGEAVAFGKDRALLLARTKLVQVKEGMIDAIKGFSDAVSSAVEHSPLIQLQKATQDLSAAQMELYGSTKEMGDVSSSVFEAMDKYTAAAQKQFQDSMSMINAMQQKAESSLKAGIGKARSPEDVAAAQAVYEAEMLKVDNLRVAAEKKLKVDMIEMMTKGAESASKIFNIRKEEADIAIDYLTQIGASFNEIYEVQKDRVKMIMQERDIAADVLKRAIDNNATGAELEEKKKNLMLKQAEVAKSVMGLQRSFYDKMVEMSFGALNKARGARRNIDSGSRTFGRGYTQMVGNGMMVAGGAMTQSARTSGILSQVGMGGMSADRMDYEKKWMKIDQEQLDNTKKNIGAPGQPAAVVGGGADVSGFVNGLVNRGVKYATDFMAGGSKQEVLPNKMAAELRISFDDLLASKLQKKVVEWVFNSDEMGKLKSNTVGKQGGA